MNILVIGMGYVGTTLSLVLAKSGHLVTGFDIDEKKIASLTKGEIYFHEPGLQPLLEEMLAKKRLSFSTNATKSMKENQVIFICVGTPSLEDGSTNLQYMKAAAKMIAANINEEKLIIIKSTVPVGTNDTMEAWIHEENITEHTVHIVSNPEFLREGNALYDSLHPNRVVIGSNNHYATELVKKLYDDVNCPIVTTTRKGAELIKYAANSFLALKISYMNEMAKLCDALGVNVQEIARGIGTDHRIGQDFLNAGIGYGGSCFPKDVASLLATAENHRISLNVMKEAVSVNNMQPRYFVSKITETIGCIKGKKLAILGLSFKPNTDDIREAPALKIIDLLLQEKAIIHAYDPVVKLKNSPIKQFSTVLKAVENTEAIIICTEWPEFKQLPWQQVKEKMNGCCIFDGRNMLDGGQLNQIGFRYKGVGYQ